jgi:glycolate oxidase
MVAPAYEAGYRELEESFGDRFGRDDPAAGPFVSPTSADEVALVAQIATRHGLSLFLRGAGTAPAAGAATDGGVSLRFELMRDVRVDDGEEPTVDLDPGIPWVELEDHLAEHGRSLRVYPTSAPRTTVGGWLARDGLGVGSYEFGWLGENVVSADIVLPGGRRETVSGESLGLVVGAEGSTGIIVSAKLRLRASSRDTPFAASFADTRDLARAVVSIAEERLPLWHLGFADPALLLSGTPAQGQVLFGTHAGELGGEIGARLERLVSDYGGTTLSTAEAYRAWGARFFPAGAHGALPTPAPALLPVAGLERALPEIRSDAGRLVAQGTVGRDGETLLTTFRTGEGGRLETPGEKDAEALLQVIRRAGGDEYGVGLRRYTGPRRDALVRFKNEVDPEGILGAT